MIAILIKGKWTLRIVYFGLVCVSVCVCVYECLCVDTHMHVRRDRWQCRSSATVCVLFSVGLLRQASHWPSSKASWPANPRNLPVSMSPVLGLQMSVFPYRFDLCCPGDNGCWTFLHRLIRHLNAVGHCLFYSSDYMDWIDFCCLILEFFM